MNEAQQVSPIGGVIFTPPAVTLMSLRESDTLNTPSFSSSFPFAPVSCSIFAVSRVSAARAKGATDSAVQINDKQARIERVERLISFSMIQRNIPSGFPCATAR